MASKRYPNAAPFWKKFLFKTYFQWTARQRRLPDFIVIGVQKSGTSSLYRYLETHPGLKLSYRKQLHFFDKQYHEGIRWYRACFPLKRGNESYKTGEATPYYIFHPHVPGRIKKHLPDTKFIAMFRNPIDRAYSHYQMKVWQGWEDAPTFEEAIDREEERIGEESKKIQADPNYYSKAHRNFSYLARGRYAEQLKRWYEHFDKDKILILNSEQFFDDQIRELRKVYDFIGLEDYIPANLKAYNQRPYSPIAPETRERLRAYFKPYNEEFFDLIGETYDWNEPLTLPAESK
jgi:hypothetical protein